MENPALCKVMIFVSDVEGCAEWYSKHFGFEIVESTRIAEQWCEVKVGPGLRVAFHRAFIEGKPVASPTGSQMNPHKLVFAVDNLTDTRSRLIAEGVTMYEVAGKIEQPRCDGLDCEQHRFQLIQRPTSQA